MDEKVKKKWFYKESLSCKSGRNVQGDWSPLFIHVSCSQPETILPSLPGDT